MKYRNMVSRESLVLLDLDVRSFWKVAFYLHSLEKRS